MSIIPFDPPRLLTAECKAGFVNVSPASYRSDSGRGWDTSGSTTEHFEGDPAERTDSPTPEPTSLQRTQTMSGNILTITGHPNHNDDTSPEAFWLQRKLGKFHSDGMIRMGYRLRGSGVRWELWKDRGEDHHTMVKVHIMPGSVLDENNNGANADVCSPVNELSALQMIASHNTNEPKHVLGTRLIATSAQDVYVILPYHQDGTLMQFCQTVGNLPEPLARFLFRQIIKGLKTLQDTGLCHRNLSLDAVEMDGDHLDICQLGWVLRFDRNTSVDEDRPLPPPGGLDPNFIAPEYFGTIRGEWNGFSADLWSSGLMLFSMVVGSGALFTAPIMEDKSFHRMCIRSDIQGQVTKYGKLVGKDFSGLSQEVLDLLGNMLKADPKQRLSLEQVMEHPWLTKDELTTPTQWKELQEAKS